MIGVRHSVCRLLAAVAVALLQLSPGYAGDRLLRFDKISLPYEANVVERIHKDGQGMVWFATHRGVFSYDGYNIRRLFEGNYHAVAAVAEDVLCFGGDDGLRWLSLRSEKLVSPYKDVPATGEVRSLTCHGGTLFVGTKSQGLFCLDLKKHSWRHYDLPDGRNDIIYSFEPAEGSMYMAHVGGLARLDSDGHVRDMGIDDNVYDVWYDKTVGCLWIGTEHHLLCRNKENGETRMVSSGSTFNQVVPSPTGDILLASEYGLKILDPHTGSIQTIGHDASSPQNGLPSNTIHQILCDGDRIWIATDRGVAITQTRNIFETVPLPAITHSSDGNIFSRILVDSEGGQWMGGDNGLLHIKGSDTKWFKVGSGLKKSIIRCIYEDRDKQVWIATDASIARYDPRRDEFEYFTLTDWKGRNANWAYDIYEDAKGRLWVATYMGGLYVVDKKALLSSGGTFVMKGNPFGSNEETVSTIYRFIPDAEGVLWANTSRGLASINTKTMEVKLRQKMFVDNMILDGGVIWLDFQGGLYKYDTRTDVLQQTDFQKKDGMIQAFVHADGRIWMSTSDGLFYIDTTDGTVLPFCKPDQGFTAGAYLQREGIILWGGEDVICRQALNDQPLAAKPPKVFLSSVRVMGKAMEDCVPRFENTIRLDGRDDIVLDLATFTYDGRNTGVFWYKIGGNGEWHSLPGGSNRIMLPHLSGGEYRLFLTMDANHGDSFVTEYILVVPHPWYLRWWAWVLYLLLAGATVWMVLNRYKRREKMLFEQREREHVMTLTQQKMDFFVNMSHELKTPLSLIIAPLAKLLSESSNAKMRSSLKSIHGNALRLNDLIHRILDFKQLETEGENLVLPSHIDLCGLVSGCTDEFAASADERGISLMKEMPDEPVLMDVDVVKVQMVLRNILSNAMKYVEDGKGKIVVHVERKVSEVVVSVNDNGPGVPNSELSKLFNRYYTGQNAREGSGIGLSVVKKYVELHGGEVKAENKDGLKVVFTLPLCAPHASDLEDKLDEMNKPVVLIVDDNREILEFLTTALESSYLCMTAQSGEDAEKMMETRIPDIVITDQMMPGIDGTELCHRIRHNHSTELVPVIMLTAKDDSDTELKSIRSGADVFMPKPFDLRKLQLHIVQLLNKRKAIEQNTRIQSMTSASHEEPALTNDEELMERIISLIDSNMHMEEFNVTKLCDLLCMDQKQLYRKIKQLTGETPVSFIRKQRMKRAAALLKQDRFTVSEVMYQVGFSSPSYFTKSFTKEFGMSPKDYSLLSEN